MSTELKNEFLTWFNNNFDLNSNMNYVEQTKKLANPINVSDNTLFSWIFSIVNPEDCAIMFHRKFTNKFNVDAVTFILMLD